MTKLIDEKIIKILGNHSNKSYYSNDFTELQKSQIKEVLKEMNVNTEFTDSLVLLINNEPKTTETFRTNNPIICDTFLLYAIMFTPEIYDPNNIPFTQITDNIEMATFPKMCMPEGNQNEYRVYQEIRIKYFPKDSFNLDITEINLSEIFTDENITKAKIPVLRHVLLRGFLIKNSDTIEIPT